MSDKELYRQKYQAQLDEWKGTVDKLKAKASAAGADVQLAKNKQIETLERKIEEGKKKLTEIAEAGDDKWESTKDGVESAWGSLKSAVSDTVKKLNA